MDTSMKEASRYCQEVSFASRSIIYTEARSICRMATSAEIFINNMERVLSDKGWSNRRLAQKSGVSDRLIGMYRSRETIPSIDKAERIARALGFELWQMQMPDFRPDIIKNGRFDKLYHAYVESDDDGRRVMESVAEYSTKKKDSSSNDPNGEDPRRQSGN